MLEDSRTHPQIIRSEDANSRDGLIVSVLLAEASVTSRHMVVESNWWCLFC